MSEDLTQNFPKGDLKLILSRLDSIGIHLNSMDARLGSMDARFNSIEVCLEKIEMRLDAMDARLTAHEERVERRLLETRPIWEGVLEQLKEANERLNRVENESKDFRRMFRAAFSDLSRVQEDFDERLDKLEGRVTPQ